MRHQLSVAFFSQAFRRDNCASGFSRVRVWRPLFSLPALVCLAVSVSGCGSGIVGASSGMLICCTTCWQKKGEAFTAWTDRGTSSWNRLRLERGVPKVLFCDNGSEFTSQAMDLWAYRNGVKIAFSRPGKPTDNAFVESFNGMFRSECLDTHWFLDLKEARQLIEAWRREYNESRPHASLDDRTPSEFAAT